MTLTDFFNGYNNNNGYVNCGCQYAMSTNCISDCPILKELKKHRKRGDFYISCSELYDTLKRDHEKLKKKIDIWKTKSKNK
jgi:hypothetical protein